MSSNVIFRDLLPYFLYGLSFQKNWLKVNMCDLFYVSNLKSDLGIKYSIFSCFCIWMTQENVIYKQSIQ